MIIFLLKAYHKFKKRQKVKQKNDFFLHRPLHFISTFPIETTNTIMEEIGDGLFSILFDESYDVSIKEQTAITLRYVDKWYIIEHFLGIVFKHNLSMLRNREQGYDRASNM